MSIVSIPTGIGMTNAEFLSFTKEIMSGDLKMAEYEKEGYPQTIAVNMRRFEGWQNRIELRSEIEEQSRKHERSWILLNEPWCLDGAFVQPLLQKIADASNGRIQLKILLRDQHPQVMDQFLTNGGRAIPKLISLNDQNELEFTWGPRPKQLQAIISELIANPDYDTHEKIKMGTRWYLKDKSVQIQEELLALMVNSK